MPDEASPRPWRVEKSPANSNFWVVRCDNGVSVATAWHEADAALIVEAVNYYKPDLHCDWRELTPEEAVAHCREVAERLGDTPCASDHLQLAAWIEERERLREELDKLNDVAVNLMRSRDAALADADRLRDLVRRMAPFVAEAEEAWSKVAATKPEEIAFTAEEDKARLIRDAKKHHAEIVSVLREAREAIGEDAP